MTKQQMKVIAQAEHEMFCLRDLLEGSVPAKVMNRAYEYVIKQDLLSVLRETPLTHQQLSVLTPQRRPLDFLYRLWLKTEYSHIDALRRAVRRETRRIYLKRQTEAFRKRASDGMNLFVGDDVTQWVIRKALYTSSRRSRLGRS